MFLLWIISLVFWRAVPLNCSPVLTELVDMTYTFDESTINWPNSKKFELNVLMNGTTERGFWIQVEEYSSAVHVGTHIDAPCHFVSGKWCVDEIPLTKLDGPAAVVDITEKAETDADATIGINDLLEWERTSGESLNGTIVVMRSGWGRRWQNRTEYIGTPDNDTNKMHFPGMSPEAARWLVEKRDIYGFMSDSLGLDRGQATDFMSHRILFAANIYGLENVANVEEIPIVGAHVYISPMKIGKSGGAPARVTARYPKVVFKEGKPGTERALREVIIFSK